VRESIRNPTFSPILPIQIRCCAALIPTREHSECAGEAAHAKKSSGNRERPGMGIQIAHHRLQCFRFILRREGQIAEVERKEVTLYTQPPKARHGKC
jgi:hypothetical protein